QQYGLGWNKEISENVTIGAEVRRTEYESDDEEDETRVGLTMSVAF
ncbi:MAG: hypothetical protein ISR65_19065, partial [Bacteriovoracaceae bacterium]|nr:hypothetical protein [Bacteriovoracaceae bacterium]